jgi:ATP-dependent DNA helicase RecQ
MTDPVARARDLLTAHFGYPDFRPGQSEVVAGILAGRDTLAILPTGGGKSVCFQVPALAMGGLAIVVSPLISLMQDQVEACRRRGIAAAALTSTTSAGERARTLEQLSRRELRLLYLSPERLVSRAAELGALVGRPALLAVDEAHCISEWGPDFRPEFRQLGRARRALGEPPCAALTGSATPEVRADITRVLGLGTRDRRGPLIVLRSFDRQNLHFAVLQVGSERERYERLLARLHRCDGLAIVYVSTRSVAEALTRSLRFAGFSALPYHARLEGEQRAAILRRFLAEDVDVVVATCAFGMGIDAPRVRLVAHWTLPGSPEAYYQEAGRAGRDGGAAHCLLLHRRGDAAMHRRMLDVTLPPERLLRRAWADPAVARRQSAEVRASIARLHAELVHHGAVNWEPHRRRRRGIAARIAMMRGFASGWGCRRRKLLGYFGEPPSVCAGCDWCDRWPWRLRKPASGQPRIIA